MDGGTDCALSAHFLRLKPCRGLLYDQLETVFEQMRLVQVIRVEFLQTTGASMTNETALFLKLLLHAGLIDVYNESLDQLLMESSTLDGVLLELAFCNQNINQSITLLRDFTYHKDIDHNVVYSRIMSVFRNQYLNQTMSQDEVSEAMHLAAMNSGKEMSQPWESIKNLIYYYEEVVDGYYPEDIYHEQFLDLLLGKEGLDSE
jgi:hypothetical protein